jgi:hypothetical protein
MNTMTCPPRSVKPSVGVAAQMVVFVVGAPDVHASVVMSIGNPNANVVTPVDELQGACTPDAMQAMGTFISLVASPATEATVIPEPPGQFPESRQIWKAPPLVPMVSWPLPVGSNVTLLALFGVRTVVRSIPE